MRAIRIYGITSRFLSAGIRGHNGNDVTVASTAHTQQDQTSASDVLLIRNFLEHESHVGMSEISRRAGRPHGSEFSAR
jgi:hypothetical protein